MGKISHDQKWGYVKRKASNAGKIPISRFCELLDVFLADIAAEVIINEIPKDLIVNWDQTGLLFVPSGEWTTNLAEENVIPITASDDKREITAVLAVSMSGEFLPPQLLYDGKTERCHLQVRFLDGLDVWHTPNHWSNEQMMMHYA